MIISISGKMGSGKDTIAEIIKQVTAGTDWEVKKFAGKLKEIASLLTSIPIEKFEDQQFKQTSLPEQWNSANGDPMTVRDLLQQLGTEAMRSGLHENVWVNALFAEYQSKIEFTESFDFVDGTDWVITPSSFCYPNWIITDTRFPNEIAACVERKGICIKVERNSEMNIGNTHASETALDEYTKWDYYIDNTGTREQLHSQIHAMCTQLNLIN